MLRFRKPERRLVAETLSDLANIAAGALVFGQAISDNALSLSRALVGLMVWIAAVGMAVALSALGDRE